MIDWSPHLVRYSELRPGSAAFVDARIPGSHMKENYCIVGKGVTENPRQPIHIHETDGFHVGAAGQPPNILNSLHSHFSAEVFMIFKGRFRIFWGAKGDNEAVLGPGDMISVPTHCFRGFEVMGDDYGFMFTLLGRDDVGGGIVWHPDVLLEGRKHGLYLLKDKSLADTTKGDPVPSEEELYPTMSPEEVAEYDEYSVDEMMEHVNFKSEITPIDSPFTTKGSFRQYNLIGDGVSSTDFSVKSRDDACIFGYEMDTNGRLPMHRRPENQVLVNMGGDVLVEFGGEGDGSTPLVLTPGDSFDHPKGLPFSLKSVRGPSMTYCFVAGNEPSHPEILE